MAEMSILARQSDKQFCNNKVQMANQTVARGQGRHQRLRQPERWERL